MTFRYDKEVRSDWSMPPEPDMGYGFLDTGLEAPFIFLFWAAMTGIGAIVGAVLSVIL